MTNPDLPAESQPTDRIGYRDALASAEFRGLLVARLVSTTGSSIAAIALAVLIYRRTSSPLLSSLAFAFGFLPYALAGVLLSALVDRVRPRQLVAWSDGISAILAALMALPRAPVSVLLTLLFGVGTLSALSSGAAGDLVRSTVSAEAYVPGRSALRLAAQFSQIGGNAAGGLLVTALSPGDLLLMNAASFLFSSVTVRIRVGDHANSGQADGMLLRDSIRGAREVLQHHEVVRLLLLGWVGAMVMVIPEAVAVPYIKLHGAPTMWVGWWLVMAPVGLILGDILGVRFLTPRRQRRLVAPVAAMSFLPLLLFATDPPVIVAIVLVFVSSLANFYVLGLDGRVRDAIPAALFARTMTLEVAGLATLEGVGFALGGAVAEAIDPESAILVGAIFGLIVTTMLFGRELLLPARTKTPLAQGEGDRLEPTCPPSSVTADGGVAS